MKKGFTIIELVIVISVLIILIGIAIPRMKGMQQSGNIVRVKGELQTLESAMESYYNFRSASTHTYITTSNTPCQTYFYNASPQIVTSVIYDPFAATATTEYIAAVSSNGLYYAFSSVGTGSSVALTVTPQGTVTHNTGNICVTNGTGC